jgi:ABC-type glycerol-3-phosphate transport system substrate-binding protein
LGAVKIDFYYEGWTLGEKAAFNALVKAFNQEHEGEIIVEASNSQRDPGAWGLFETMSTDYDCYLSQTAPDYAAQSDDVLDLTAFLEADSAFQQDFYPSLLNESRYQGVLYSLPLSIQPGLIVYNADLLAERSLEPPSPDWTFDEFIELITAVTSTEGPEQIAGLLHSSNSVSIFDLFVAGRNTQWLDTSGENPVVTLNTPEMADTLIWYNEFDDTGVFFQPSRDQDWWYSISSAVVSGDVGFWTARAGEEEREFFNLRKPSFEVGIAPLPSTPLPNGPIDISYVLGFYISSETEHSQACWELAKYLSEHTEVLNGMPSRISVANSPAWEAQVGIEKAEVYRMAAKRPLAEMDEDSINSYFWTPISSWLGRASGQIGAGNNPEQELARAQQYADAYLDCMALVDIADLTIEELYAAVQACEVQVDPTYYN